MALSKQVSIVDYEPKFRQAFKDLNKEWIDEYFKMEESDYKYLDHPEENIIQKGGYILVAVYEEKAIGICALVKMAETEKQDYELAKMAIAPEFHGQGLGYLLANAVIEKAKSVKAKSLYLESNTILVPAVRLYRKLGFTEIKGISSPYERTNIHMELLL